VGTVPHQTLRHQGRCPPRRCPLHRLVQPRSAGTARAR
jgi:hypothetical protein